MNSTNGVIIAGVLNNGPADQAGIRPGDIVIEINGTEVIDGKHAITLISRVPPGQEVKIEFLRAGKSMSKKIITSQRPVIRQKQ